MSLSTTRLPRLSGMVGPWGVGRGTVCRLMVAGEYRHPVRPARMRSTCNWWARGIVRFTVALGAFSRRSRGPKGRDVVRSGLVTTGGLPVPQTRGCAPSSLEGMLFRLPLLMVAAGANGPGEGTVAPRSLRVAVKGCQHSSKYLAGSPRPLVHGQRPGRRGLGP